MKVCPFKKEKKLKTQCVCACVFFKRERERERKDKAGQQVHFQRLSHHVNSPISLIRQQKEKKVLL